jgi:hypothetical protein
VRAYASGPVQSLMLHCKARLLQSPLYKQLIFIDLINCLDGGRACDAALCRFRDKVSH